MASHKWYVRPGGYIVRYRKSRSDHRPGGGTTGFVRQVAPHFFRNLLNRRERRRVRRSIVRGDAEPRPYVHPREAAWCW
jgi:hypothetical protein